jgi:hypothetical protein
VLATEKPDIVVILAWIYADPILKRNEAYLGAGGKFLVPLPEPRIVDKAGTTPFWADPSTCHPIASLKNASK